MDKISNIIKKNIMKAIIVLIGCLIFYSVMAWFNQPFYYDSGQYWNLSYSFVSDSGFSFLNYPYVLRGYVYPFVIMLSRNVFSIFGATDIQSYMLFFSFVYSGCIYYIATNLCKYIFNVKIKYWLILIVYCLIAFVWPGLIYYPLTDMLAYFLLCILLILSFKFKDTSSVLTRIVYAVMLGAGGYFLYNIRSIYIVPLAVGCIFLTLRLKKFMIISVLALSIVSIPQGIINMNTNGIYSIKLNSNYGTVGDEDLNLFMFRYGINGLRYEGFVGDSSVGYPGAIDFLSPVGHELLKNEKITRFETMGEYIEFVLKYPFDVIGIYANHFLAGLDARFGEIYLQNPNSYRGMYTIANIIIIFLTLFGLFVEYLKSSETKKYMNKKNWGGSINFELAGDCVNTICCRNEILFSTSFSDVLVHYF